METQKQMLVRMDPATIKLERTQPKLVHDVGEMVKIKCAEGTRTVSVIAEDLESGAPIDNAVVHVGGLRMPANQPFRFTFRAEFDEKFDRWTPDVVWVESPGYENVEVEYGVEIEDM